ncbi:hypothetical protein Q5752_001637 [Cryptotrichosporon argae]
MMTPRWRYIGAAVGVLFSLHLLASIHPTYRASTSPFSLFPSSWTDGDYVASGQPPASAVPAVSGELPTADQLRIAAGIEDRRKANAAFVVLARNSDLWPIIESMRQMEDRFNYWAQYDYVFLNEVEFSDEFKRYTQSVTSAKCHYGLIEPEHWFQPEWIDEEKAKAAREEMIRKKVIYGHSVPYRNMCRFYSGFFFRHALLASYDYYWRIDPSVKFFCDITYDPFLLMQDEQKVYGFTLSLYEYIETIPTLWNSVKEFIAEHPEHLAEDNAIAFISDDGGESYNKCHFWSNFEIGDLNFWRSDAYMEFFEFLNRKGGFYYERWGDAPVHSIAAALFARKDQIHFFQDIGYRHEPFQHCPQGEAHTRGKCWCDPKNNFDFEWYSCTTRYNKLFEGDGA